jgi:hypothetical protein
MEEKHKWLHKEILSYNWLKLYLLENDMKTWSYPEDYAMEIQKGKKMKRTHQKLVSS